MTFSIRSFLDLRPAQRQTPYTAEKGLKGPADTGLRVCTHGDTRMLTSAYERYGRGHTKDAGATIVPPRMLAIMSITCSLPSLEHSES
jgi:hypothetical protein